MRTFRTGTGFGYSTTTMFDPTERPDLAEEYGLAGEFAHPASVLVTTITMVNFYTGLVVELTLVSAIGTSADNATDGPCSLCGDGPCHFESLFTDDSDTRPHSRFHGGSDGMTDTQSNGFDPLGWLRDRASGTRWGRFIV